MSFFSATRFTETFRPLGSLKPLTSTFVSSGGNGNRGGGGGGSNGSGGGGWDCGNDWHWEAEISGKKERRNAVEGEDRSSRNGFVAGGAGSGEYIEY